MAAAVFVNGQWTPTGNGDPEPEWPNDPPSEEPPAAPLTASATPAITTTASTSSEGSEAASSSSSSDSKYGSGSDGNSSSGVQWIHILRHGERRDFIEPHSPSSDWHRYDPPLSAYGHAQAGEAGAYIGESIKNGHFTIDRIICSPFIRTVETAWNVVKAARASGASIGPISIEYGVAEWHPAQWIKAFLPQKTAMDVISQHEGSTEEARELAAGAIDQEYKTLFSAEYFDAMINSGIGETLEAAQRRANYAVELLTQQFPHQNLLIVTHAIHSIGLTRAYLRDYNYPVRAGVCSISSLQRSLLLPSSPTSGSVGSSSPPASSDTSDSTVVWKVINNGLSSFLSRGEQHWWLIPGEEERVYGVRKVPTVSKVPVYITLTDEEKIAWQTKQVTTTESKSTSVQTPTAGATTTTATTGAVPSAVVKPAAVVITAATVPAVASTSSPSSPYT